MKKWMQCLCGVVVMTMVPHMAYAADSLEYTAIQNVQISTNIGEYIWPINVEAEVLAPFGQVRSGYTHQGIDLRLPIGTPIYAIADAKVIKAAPDSKGINAGGGHIIMLDHGNGVQSWYMHLDAYAVNLGDEVKKGQIIGFSGNSGDSTTPHLHFEYRINGVPLDPNLMMITGGIVIGQDEVVIEEAKLPLITLDEPFIVVQS